MLTPHTETNLPAEHVPAPIVVWERLKRPALITGIVAGEVTLLATISQYAWLDEALAFVLGPAVFVGIVGAVWAAVRARRRGGHTMTGLETDLQHAAQLMERRLINEEEYQTLKAKLVADYQPRRPIEARSAWRTGLWSAFGGFSLANFGFAMSVAWEPGLVLVATVAAMIGGAIVGGGASAGVQLIRRRLAHGPLLGRGSRDALDDPILRDRPALEG